MNDPNPNNARTVELNCPNIQQECAGGPAATTVPSADLNRKKSRARLVLILFMVALVLLFVQLFANPYVVTVYSKGCWSINTDGLFNHFNVQGCGNQSWMMIDLYAHIHNVPLVNGLSVPGGEDLSIFLSQGPGSGGSCVGGSACVNLSAFSPSNLAWKDLTSQRKTFTVFSLGFLAYATYQFIAIWLSLFVGPVPQYGLIGEGLVLILATVWLARFIGWKFPFQRSFTLPSTVSS